MTLDAGQKFEKAVQHTIAFGHFMAHTELREGATTADVLIAAAARAYRCQCIQEGQTKPDEWIAQEFSQYMRECVMTA